MNLGAKLQKIPKNLHNSLKSCTFAPHFNGNHREEGPIVHNIHS